MNFPSLLRYTLSALLMLAVYPLVYAQDKLPVVNINLAPGQALQLSYFDNLPNSRLETPANSALHQVNRQVLNNDADSFRTVARLNNQGKSFLLLRFYIGYNQSQGYVLLPEKAGQVIPTQPLILFHTTTSPEDLKTVTYSWILPDDQGMPEWFVWQGSLNKADGTGSSRFNWQRWNGQQWQAAEDPQGQIVLDQYLLTLPVIE